MKKIFTFLLVMLFSVRALAQLPAASCIPAPYYASGSCDNGWSFSSVSLTGVAGTAINDTTSCNGTGYIDNTALSCSLNVGNSYSIYITDEDAFGMGTFTQFWIDFNGDGIFQPSESVGGSPYYFVGFITVNITIPSNAAGGTFRMRGVIDYQYDGQPNYPNMDPCMAGYNEGEARDYTVTILSGSQIKGILDLCLGGTTTLTDSLTGGSWSSSNTSAATIDSSGNVTAIAAGATTITYTADGGINIATLVVNALPTPTVTAGGPTTFCSGSSVMLSTGGNAGNALNFNGSNYVATNSTTSVSNLGVSGYTLEAWVYYSGSSSVNSIFRKSGDYNFYIYNNKLGAEVWPAGAGVSSSFYQTFGSVTIPANTWTHVAATWDGSTTTLYVNGVADGAASTGTNASGANEYLWLGYSHDFGQGFEGTMDELSIWNTARTQTQIAANMSSGISTPSTNLVAYYKFDEGSGGTTADATGNGNDGTLQNSPTWVVPSTAPIYYSNYLWSPGSAATSSISATTSGSYSVMVTDANGCTGTSTGTSVSVNGTPIINTGASVICPGSTITLSDAVTGGIWSSGNTAIATVDASGDVTGIGGGTATISYSVGGCTLETVVGVNSYGVQAEWGVTGTAGFSAGLADYTSIAIGPDGTPYVAYEDVADGSGRATVMKYNGSSWVTVGSEYFSAGAALSPSLALDGSGTPYVAYADNAVGQAVTVMKYNGSSWVMVGSAGFSAGGAATPSLAIDGSGTPYVAYTDFATGSNSATVMKHNDTGWVTVGSAGFSSGEALNPSLAIGQDGTPYVAYEDVDNGAAATVMKYNGGSWVAVGTAGFTVGQVNTPSLAIGPDGTPYVAYGDYGYSSSKATVMKYNGSSWVMVGSAGFSAGAAATPSLAIGQDGTPYVAYSDNGNSNKATVMKYDGSSWVTVGSAGFSAGAANYTSLAINRSGTPYVAYSEASTAFAYSGAATVQQLNAPSIAIIGPSKVRAGNTITLTDSAAGGTWSSGNTGIATVGSTGIVSGIAAGTAAITYTLAGGCSSIATVTVLCAPIITSVSPMMGYPASAATITGSNFNTTTGDDIVYFGATRATVSAASATSLSVTVPSGATYMPVTVLNTGCVTTGYADQAFLPTYNNSGYAPGVFNFDTAVGYNGDASFGVAIGDLDGDGHPDVVVANIYDNTITIYRNTGNDSINVRSFVYSVTGVTFSTGGGPLDVAIGDIDGDGKPDIVVTNSSSNTVSVFRNISTSGIITEASFAAKVDFATGDGPYGVTIGDMDGDGKPDLLVANTGDGTVSVFRNTGSAGVIDAGTFAAKADFVAGGNPYIVAIGDLDGDGKPDIAVANYVNQNVSFLRNTSSPGVIDAGSFVAAGSVAASGYAQSVAIGDLDGDGKPDIAIASNSTYVISVYQNTSTAGAVSFGSEIQFPFAGGISTASNVAIGDIDGDGKPDLLVQDGNNDVAILRNTSTPGSITTGSFAAYVTFPAGSSLDGSGGMSIGDIDGDGKPDIVVANAGNPAFIILKNDPMPASAAITGNGSVCAGSATALSDATTGGTWSSSNTAVASVDGSGDVTGVMAGTATISYIVSGSTTTAVVTVNATSVVSAGSNVSIYSGSSTTLTASGGTTYSWSPATGLSAATGASVIATPAVTTIYTVTGTGTCGSRMAEVTVSVDAVPTLSGSTACTGSLLTVTSSLQLTQIIWQLGGTGISTVTPTIAATGIAVAGTGGFGSGATQLSSPGSVFVDGNGNVYTADENNNRIQEWAPGATTGTTVAGGNGDGSGADQLSNPSGAYVDGSGNIYIADLENFRIQLWSPGATAGTTVAGGNGSGSDANQFATPTGLYVDGSGNIYVVDEGNNRIQEWAPGATAGITVAGGNGFGSGANQLAYPNGVYVDGSGNIYVADLLNDRIQEWAPGAIAGTTVAGTGTAGSGATQLNWPWGVYVDGSNNIYVADLQNSRVQEWAAGATTGITVAGVGGIGSGATQLNSPNGVYVDGSGNVYVSDEGNNRVQKFAASITTTLTATTAGNYNAVVTTVAGSATTNTVTVNATPVISAGSNVSIYSGSSTTLTASGGTTYSWSPATGLSAATGASVIATPAVTTIYTVTGTGNCGGSMAEVTVSVDAVPTLSGSTACTGSLLTVTSSLQPTQIIWQLGGTGISTVTPTIAATGIAVAGTGGFGSGATQLSSPGSVFVDGNGNVYTADENNNRIQEWAPGATTGTTVAGGNGDGSGADQLSNPSGAYVDGSGNIYIADLENFRIQLWSPGATAGTTVAGGNGSGSDANQFATPTGLYVDGSGNIYVVDEGNNRIQEWAPGATAGITVAGGNGFGSGANQLAYPNGVYVDGSGNIYVADLLNDRIQKWAPGAIAGTTVAGTGTAGSGATQLNWPWGVYVDGSNNIYVADLQNSRVQEWAAGATTGITVAGVGGIGSGATQLNSPNGVYVDGSGNVYVSDEGNNRVQKFAASITTTLTATTAGNYNAVVTTVAGSATTNTVTVNATANAGTITGTTTLCAGGTTQLTDAVTGGSWSSNNTAVVTVNTSGLVTGVGSGSTTIFYTTTNSCGSNYAYAILFVNPAANAGTITGTTTLCAGGTTQLTDAVTGGSWSSNNTAVVTVNTSGLVTGVGSGSTTIFYTTTGSCGSNYAYAILFVNPAANAGTIAGPSSVTVGSNIMLTDAVGGGSWSSSNTDASVSGGLVTGNVAGTTTISYAVTGSCGTAHATKVITVNNAAIPGINGNTAICQGSSTQFTDSSSGGVWSLSSGYATVVGSTGVVTAVSSGAHGTATLTYTVGGVAATIEITVNPNPSAVQGVSSACAGTTVMLTDLTAGGTWSSTGAASISGAGTTTTFVGTTAGTVSITYMITATGCISQPFTTTIVAKPDSILGVFNLCAGVTTQLSDLVTGGGWTSSNTAVATVSGAYVTGHIAGTSTLTYILSGCSVTQTITMNALPGAISGNPGRVCPGASFTLADGTGGVWTSGNTAVATVDVSGDVTGVSGGTSVITYALPGVTGCASTSTVTINAAPAISGPGSICSNGSVTFSDGSAGGTWSGNNGSVATVGSSTGLVTPTGAGTVTIAYKTSGGCTVTAIVTVNGAPTAIGGATNKVCAGNTITLTDNTAPGVWSSSNTTVGTVDVTGDITGIGTGTTLITYSSGGCSVSAVVTVNGLPGTINGASGVCSGATVTLTDITTGGVWSITGGTATIGSTTGIVTGTASGTATVSYTIASTGCSIGDVLTISTTAGAIGGSGQVCVGLSDQLTDAGGGTWSSSSTTVAQIGSTTGLLVGEASGTATISYLSGGCYAKTVVTVSALPGVIKGLTSVCQGLTLSLSDATTGGTWSSTNITVGTVGSTGLVTSLITGATIAATDSIIYKSAAGCTASVSITVNPLPQAIHGDTSLCQGKATTLTDGSEPGGTWSLIGSVATIVGSSGVITAASSGANGVVTVSYTSGGCSVTKVVSVNSNPSAVQGVGTACVGTTVMLTDLTAGGSWSSTGAASISGAGTTTTFVGSTAGTVSITYMIAATGCISQSFTTTIVANPAPIAGVFSLCTGVTTQLSDPSAGGGWTSGNTAVATVSGAYVTGHMAGTAILTYVLSGCSATQAVTMTQTPVVGVIGAPATISFAGGAVTISDTTAGGIWTSSSTVIALIGSTETMTTIKAMATVTTGSSVISYTVTNGICATTVTKTIGAATAVRPGGGTGTGGTTVVYVGTAATLPADELSGGLWSSSDNSIATVDGNGVVTGMMPGIAMITHEVTGDDGTVTANVTDVVVTAVPASISLVPNPNKGTFVVKGTLGTQTNEEVTLEVTDVLGQVLYSGKVMTDGGRLNATVNLSNVVANGMYMLNVKSGTENKTLHFVIEQ